MSDTNTDGHGDHGDHHVAPAWIFHAVFAALVVLTVVTVLASKIELGRQGNIILALAIAIVKASLVCTFFMHLRWDKPFNTVILLGSIAFAGLFVSISTLDTAENEWRKVPDYAEKRMALKRTQQGIEYHRGPATPAGPDVALGKQIYDQSCLVCHGDKGQGMPGLGKNMPNSEFITGKSDAELVAFLQVGRNVDDPLNTTKVAMPAYGNRKDLFETDGKLDMSKLEAVIAYIRTLPK